jgi:prolyl-tRNA synthetase
LAEDVYARLQTAGIDILYDDRAERAGVKFKDADLIGVPIQIVAGRLAAEGRVEIRDRASKAAVPVSAHDVAAEIARRIKS